MLKLLKTEWRILVPDAVRRDEAMDVCLEDLRQAGSRAGIRFVVAGGAGWFRFDLYYLPGPPEPYGLALPWRRNSTNAERQ